MLMLKAGFWENWNQWEAIVDLMVVKTINFVKKHALLVQ
jgi:hypothetical protein